MDKYIREESLVILMGLGVPTESGVARSNAAMLIVSLCGASVASTSVGSSNLMLRMVWQKEKKKECPVQETSKG